MSLCAQRFRLVPGKSTALYSLLCSSFKIAYDRAKESNYVHGYISGTQVVSTAPFCAGTQALVLRHQVCIGP